MQFEGDDMVAYSFPRGRMRTLQDHYALNFKTLEKDGILLHSEGLQGDSITLELKTGRLYLHISLGNDDKSICLSIHCFIYNHRTCISALFQGVALFITPMG